MNALEVVQAIVDGHHLLGATFTLIVHRAAPGWSERYRTTEERIDGALDDAAPEGQAWRRMSGGQLARATMDDIDGCRTGRDELVSISSRVEVGGEVCHLALMDIHPEEFIAHDALWTAVHRLCDRQQFWLLRTDRHHHVYGDFLMSEHEWRGWIARFQMTCVLVDAHYLGRSMLSGYNTLRLNASTEYQTVVPTTVNGEHDSLRRPIASNAIQLARRRQSKQLRRSGEPTMHHLDEVAGLAEAIRDACFARGAPRLRDVQTDELYACGYLHDSIEDSPTDYEDVVKAAGTRVAEWVRTLSEDKRLPEAQRRSEYERQIASADDVVKIVKLADLVSNLRGIRGSEDARWMSDYLGVAASHLDLLTADLGWTTWFGEARSLVARWQRWLGAGERARSAAAVR